jgi:hypothetical protein
MQPSILARRIGPALLLLVPAAALGQTGTAPPPPPPAVLLAPEPLPEPILPEPATNRPTATDPPPSAAAGAFDAPGLFGGPFGGFDPRSLSIFRGSYAATWFPDERVSGQPTHLGYFQEDVLVSVPLYHDGCDTWAVSLRGRNETFSTQAFLTHSERRFPEDLWAVNFATTYAHEFDKGLFAGGTVSVGSPSDQPFHSIDEITVGVNAFLRIPSGERNAWLFTLSYSPTAEVNFPIPMVAYIYNPSDHLRINIGLPFQVMYRPTDELTLNFSYMLLRTVHAQVSYRLLPGVRLHGGFDWENESYFLADRVNVNDRLFYYDMRLSGGVLFNLSKSFTIDLTGGYVFDRFYFEGAQYADKNTNELDVGAGPYIALRGTLRW